MTRRKPSKKKQRTISLSFTAVESFNGFSIDHDTGHIEPLMNGVPVKNGLKRVSTSVSYQRNKSPKIITKIPQTTEQFQMSPYSFLQHFDVIFAVDTNSRKIGSDLHSVAAMSILEVLEITKKPNGAITKVKLNMNMFGALIRGKNIPGNPESWFWKIAIEDGIKKLYPKYSIDLRIGLVVDSNLDNIEKFNSRELPIYENYYLPKNISLIYASADTGSDYVLNKLIMICDREACLQLDSIEKGTSTNEVYTKLSGDKEVKVPGTPFRFYDE